MSLLKRMVGLKPARSEWFCPNDAPHHGCHPGDGVELIYLGTAGFIIRNAARTVVLDPYLSRPDLRRTVSAKLVPDKALIKKVIPQADDVLIGHSHYDHVLDAPEICIQTRARLIGSRSTMMIGRAAGVPVHQLRETAGNEDIRAGDWTLRGVPSRHGKVFGRVPFPGDIHFPPPWPPRMGDLKHGPVLNWIVNTGALTIAHVDSADFINEELQGHCCDVLCLCAIGRKYRKDYTKEIIGLLKPRWVVPCHWDTMITPLESDPDLIPTVDLPGFMDEIRDAGAEPMLAPILGRLRFPCGC